MLYLGWISNTENGYFDYYTEAEVAVLRSNGYTVRKVREFSGDELLQVRNRQRGNAHADGHRENGSARLQARNLSPDDAE